MNNFIIFKTKAITPAGSNTSDDGTDIEVLAVSVDRIAFITAKLGGITIFFDGISAYEESNLATGESFQKSFVTVDCEKGKELQLIKDISDFASAKSTRSYMTFDATLRSDLRAVSDDIKVFVKNNPVNRVSGQPSLVLDNSFTASTANVVNDIDFLTTVNKPILDLDCRDATYSAGALATWPNGGTGGTTYDVNNSATVGTVSEGTGSSTNGFNTNPVSFLVSSYVELANTLTVPNDYTVYAVVTSAADGAEGRMGSLYGSDNGETTGFSSTTEDVKQPTVQNVLGFRHKGRTGLPASVSSSISFDKDLPTVVMIRRDQFDNIIVHGFDGSVIASIQASGEDQDETVSENYTDDFNTAGDLEIVQIGTSGDNTTASFKGSLGRFGVIKRDIGAVAATKLATDLHELYNL